MLGSDAGVLAAAAATSDTSVVAVAIIHRDAYVRFILSVLDPALSSSRIFNQISQGSAGTALTPGRFEAVAQAVDRRYLEAARGEVTAALVACDFENLLNTDAADVAPRHELVVFAHDEQARSFERRADLRNRHARQTELG